MRKLIALLAILAIAGAADAAWGWHLDGHVTCDGTGEPLEGVTVQVTSTDGHGFTGTTGTYASGYYYLALPETPGCYVASVIPGPGEHVTLPAGNAFAFCVDEEGSVITRDFVVWSPTCVEAACWLTAGGARFSSLTGTYLGQSSTQKASKMYNWGGNVNPGCSPTAGEGGQWNTIDALQKLHFQGFAIQVVRCGNVDGIPPGSTSPPTPYNFIEFTGTGRVQGVQGNKADYPLVHFFGRAEDRNEPGSNGMRDGAGKDRYFLNVYTDPANPTGTSLILVDVDGNAATVDPLTITDGNMQIHISSCDAPAPLTRQRVIGSLDAPVSQLPGEVAFATPGPNPTSGQTVLRYTLPRVADVTLAAYDVTGRLVRTLETGTAAAGLHAYTWDLRDGTGSPLPRGVYFLRLAVDGAVFTRPLSVIH